MTCEEKRRPGVRLDEGVEMVRVHVLPLPPLAAVRRGREADSCVPQEAAKREKRERPPHAFVCIKMAK